MQKLRGYLALGIFIMGIASFLCLLLPLIEITDDALMLMVFAVPPLICGLIIALALHMLLLYAASGAVRLQNTGVGFVLFFSISAGKPSVGACSTFRRRSARWAYCWRLFRGKRKRAGSRNGRGRRCFTCRRRWRYCSMRWQSICMGQHPPLPALCWRGGIRFSASSCRQAKFGKYSSPKNGAKCADAVPAGGEPDGSPAHGNAGGVLHAAGQNSGSE